MNYSQTKQELINEIESNKKSKLLNFSYEVEFKDLFNAMSIKGNQFFSQPILESESKGHIEYISENGNKKEPLILEIKGNLNPFRILFIYKAERKSIHYKPIGTFGKLYYKISAV